MKLHPIAYAFLLFALSCQNNEAGEADSVPASTGQNTSARQVNNQDAEAIVEAIDSAIDSIQRVHRKTPIFRVKHNTYSEKDAIGILEAEGKQFRIAATFYPPEEEIMDIFYLLDDHIALHKRRHWRKGPNNPGATESSVYLNKKGVVKAIMRSVVLEPGHNPSGVLSADPYEMKADRDSLFRAVKEDFKKIQKLIEENK